jgi:hypothetical protein
MPVSGEAASARKIDRSLSPLALNSVRQSPAKVMSKNSVKPRPSRQNRIDRSTSAVQIAA